MPSAVIDERRCYLPVVAGRRDSVAPCCVDSDMRVSPTGRWCVLTLATSATHEAVALRGRIFYIFATNARIDNRKKTCQAASNISSRCPHNITCDRDWSSSQSHKVTTDLHYDSQKLSMSNFKYVTSRQTMRNRLQIHLHSVTGNTNSTNTPWLIRKRLPNVQPGDLWLYWSDMLIYVFSYRRRFWLPATSHEITRPPIRWGPIATWSENVKHVGSGGQ